MMIQLATFTSDNVFCMEVVLLGTLCRLRTQFTGFRAVVDTTEMLLMWVVSILYTSPRAGRFTTLDATLVESLAIMAAFVFDLKITGFSTPLFDAIAWTHMFSISASMLITVTELESAFLLGGFTAFDNLASSSTLVISVTVTVFSMTKSFDAFPLTVAALFVTEQTQALCTLDEAVDTLTLPIKC